MQTDQLEHMREKLRMAQEDARSFQSKNDLIERLVLVLICLLSAHKKRVFRLSRSVVAALIIIIITINIITTITISIAITIIIVSITKCSLVIGSARAYCCVIVARSRGYPTTAVQFELFVTGSL